MQKKGATRGRGEKKVSTSPDAAEAAGDPVEQSVWAQKLPEEVLFRVRIKPSSI